MTLTIEPGAVLRFAAAADQMAAGDDVTDTELRVLGTLVADGTLSQGIRFTSDAASPARGNWYGIYLAPSSTNSILDFATVEYARYAVRSSAPSGTTIQRSTLRESSSYALYADGGGAAFDQLVIRDNGNRGVYVGGASGSLTNSVIHSNASYGVYLTSGTLNNSFSMIRNTIVDNSSYGVYVAGNSSLSVTLRDNIITNNGTYGVYRSSSAVVSDSYNLVWGQNTGYSGLVPGTGALSENPLFVNRSASDYRITSRSPARFHASDGGDVGALIFDGAPTVGEQGHLYTDTTWTTAASPISVLGDITVEPGVTLTIEPGVQVNFAPGADSMGGNTAPTLTELIVAGRLQVNGTAASRVTLSSGAITPARGDWYGVHLLSTAANTSVRNAYIRYARYGVQSAAPSSASVAQSEVDQSSSYALYVDGGAAVFDGVYVHHNGNRGVYVGGASPSLLNLVVVANVSYGIYLTSGSTATTVTVNHATIDGNSSYGMYIAGNSSLSVNVRNSIITNNGTYGIYRSSSAIVSLGTNNVWNNGTNFSGITAPPPP
ncbi:MAG: right-handed parallel beta-helix repeat-containing protein [Deltaproteobacteria bacterium]|nr:right-handed parallel beta-helix repeat-containing protein [Deltaproteobacteria bacterium]